MGGKRQRIYLPTVDQLESIDLKVKKKENPKKIFLIKRDVTNHRVEKNRH